mgnify:CR=1 FL=1
MTLGIYLYNLRYIKDNQIIGVEYQSHIYALLVSNLLIHNSGVKNVFSGSCFDEQNISLIKNK